MDYNALCKHKEPFQCAELYKEYYFFILHEIRCEHVLRMLRKKYTKLQRSECATSISPLLLI